jgi:hypothetical protein
MPAAIISAAFIRAPLEVARGTDTSGAHRVDIMYCLGLIIIGYTYDA